MDEIVNSLSPAEQRAVALVKAAFDSHNSRDGVGLFTGVTRYAAFEERARLAAIRSRSVRQWWALMSRMLKLPLTPVRLDAHILGLLSGDDDNAVLRVLSDQMAPTVMIARALHGDDKAAKRALAAEAAAVINAPIDAPSVPPAKGDFFNDELPL